MFILAIHGCCNFFLFFFNLITYIYKQWIECGNQNFIYINLLVLIMVCYLLGIISNLWAIRMCYFRMPTVVVHWHHKVCLLPKKLLQVELFIVPSNSNYNPPSSSFFQLLYSIIFILYEQLLCIYLCINIAMKFILVVLLDQCIY
jgi:hypothetical protein